MYTQDIYASDIKIYAVYLQIYDFQQILFVTFTQAFELQHLCLMFQHESIAGLKIFQHRETLPQHVFTLDNKTQSYANLFRFAGENIRNFSQCEKWLRTVNDEKTFSREK